MPPTLSPRDSGKASVARADIEPPAGTCTAAASAEMLELQAASLEPEPAARGASIGIGCTVILL